MSEKTNSKCLLPPPARQAGSDLAVWAGTVWLPKENSEVKKLPDHSGPSGAGRRGALGQLGNEGAVFSKPRQNRLCRSHHPG